MTTAVAYAAGTSDVLGIARAGYRVSWVQVGYPHEAGYRVTWAQISIPALSGNVGIAAGIGSADAVARAIAAAAWSANGVAVVTAAGLAEYGITAFQAYGTSDLQAIGVSLAAAIANSGGIGSAYGINPIPLLLTGAGGKNGPKKLMRAIVNDDLDLYDLRDIWELIMRKAA